MSSKELNNKLLLASFHNKKGYFRHFSSEEGQNKSHNLKIKAFVLSSGKKWIGICPRAGICKLLF